MDSRFKPVMTSVAATRSDPMSILESDGGGMTSRRAVIKARRLECI